MAVRQKHVTEMSPESFDWLARLEGGHRLKAYLDSGGLPTIGAGLTTIYGRRVKMGDTLDQEQAELLFMDRIGQDEEHVDHVTRDDISQQEFDALVSFSYNVGREALKRSTLLRLVNEHAPLGDIEAQLMRWVYDNGVRVKGLVVRRRCEALCYTVGQYVTQGEVEIA